MPNVRAHFEQLKHRFEWQSVLLAMRVQSEHRQLREKQLESYVHIRLTAIFRRAFANPRSDKFLPQSNIGTEILGK